MKRRLRILVLMHESLVPPTSLEGLSQAEIDRCKTEYDVMAFLEHQGHEVKALGLYDNLSELRDTLADWQPDVAFNLLEEFQGIVNYDHYMVAYLELRRTPYTGCNPRGMMLSRDKVLSKQILSYHRIATPNFALIRRRPRWRVPKKLRYPLFVKSATEDASLGIAQSSVVWSEKELRERVGFIHDKVRTDALVEEFIEGRELYVGVLGNDRVTTLPVWEMDFGTLGQQDPSATVATRKVKWDGKYQQKHGISTHAARDLPDGAAVAIEKTSKRIYKALHMSGYARMDFRLRGDGALYLLEANCNPNLTYGEDFAESAEVAGIGYGDLLEKIVRLGLAYRAEWTQFEA